MSLSKHLIVGAKIKLGSQYCKECGGTEGDIITLVKGEFEHDNGLYTSTQFSPAIWNEKQREFDSIYHLFGNDFEYFFDCEIIYPDFQTEYQCQQSPQQPTQQSRKAERKL